MSAFWEMEICVRSQFFLKKIFRCFRKSRTIADFQWNLSHSSADINAHPFISFQHAENESTISLAIHFSCIDIPAKCQYSSKWKQSESFIQINSNPGNFQIIWVQDRGEVEIEIYFNLISVWVNAIYFARILCACQKNIFSPLDFVRARKIRNTNLFLQNSFENRLHQNFISIDWIWLEYVVRCI